MYEHGFPAPPVNLALMLDALDEIAKDLTALRSQFSTSSPEWSTLVDAARRLGNIANTLRGKEIR